MNNPYEILGVKPNASDEEVKAAYRELVKKYHPDKYQNNPLADLAEEKLQSINEAYDAIMKNRNNGASGNTYGGTYGGTSQYGPGSSRGYSGGYSSGNYGGYSQSAGGQNSVYVQVRQALDMNNLAMAEQLLVNAPGRDAQWYFLSSVLSYKKGYTDDAISNIRQAMDMDSSNMEYRMMYQRMVSAGNFYRSSSQTRGYNENNDMCSTCCTMYLCSSCISPCW